MEFRWLSAEEQRARCVESRSLSEVLTLAQKLQAEADGLLTEEQVIETGRELGIRPEYVREALRLRQQPPPLGPSPVAEATLAPFESRWAAVAQGFVVMGALGLFPWTMHRLDDIQLAPMAWFAFPAAIIAGWIARYPKLAALAGALAVPVVLCVAGVYGLTGQGLPIEIIALSIATFCPLCSVAGRAGAKLRRWAERLVERMGGMVLEH
jgi:hypothetical protein